MKIKLLENNKIIIVPSYWRYKIVNGKTTSPKTTPTAKTNDTIYLNKF